MNKQTNSICKHENALQYIKSPVFDIDNVPQKSSDRLKWHHNIQTDIEVSPIGHQHCC